MKRNKINKSNNKFNKKLNLLKINEEYSNRKNISKI